MYRLCHSCQTLRSIKYFTEKIPNKNCENCRKKIKYYTKKNIEIKDKTCTICYKTKPITAFIKKKNSSEFIVCKQCYTSQDSTLLEYTRAIYSRIRVNIKNFNKKYNGKILFLISVSD